MISPVERCKHGLTFARGSAPPRRRAAALAAVVLALCALGLAGVVPSEPTSGRVAASLPAASDGPNQSGQSPCRVAADKTAGPDPLLLGETATVTLTMGGTCPEDNTLPLHLVLVLDASGSMAGQPTAELKAAAAQLVRDLDLPNHPETEIGIVEFNTESRRLCPLTNREETALRCLDRVGAEGGTRIDMGLREGERVLRAGRRPYRGEFVEVIVALSDGRNNAGCDPVLTAADLIKNQDMLLMTICIGPACDAGCMRQAASADRYFFQAADATQLKATFDRIRGEIERVTFRYVTIVDRLPDTVRYVPGSAVPPAAEVDDARGELRWELSHVPDDGVTLTFRVRPLAAGRQPVNAAAQGVYVDNQGRSGRFAYGVPALDVLSPVVLPTPATVPPTDTPSPSPSPTPSETPTPTATPRPTATPTPRPSPIFLPIALNEQCDPKRFYADIALVLDMSTSMNAPTRGGRPKLEAVLEAAEVFVEQIDLTPDADGRHPQVAIVGFNRRAWIEQPLTADRRALTSALRALPAGQVPGTRLDLAFQRGAEALRSTARAPENTPTLILLTDGLPTGVPPAEDGSMATTVLRTADATKRADVVVYTIGVGRTDPDAPPAERIDADLLRAAASDPSKFFHEPDAEQLNEVYRAIIGTLGCPPGRHPWWGETP